MSTSVVRLTAILLPLWIACVSLAQETAPLSQRDAVLPMQQVVPTRSSASLINPGMGLYLYGTLDANDLPADVWFSPLIQIG